MAPLSGLIGKFLGAEQAPIRIEQDGKEVYGDGREARGHGRRRRHGNRSERHGTDVLENTGHPVSSRLAVAHASKSHVHALGLAWDDASAGRTTGNTRPSIGGVHNQTLDPRPPTRIERALGRQRAASIVLLILLPLVCWSWIVVMARDMYGPMTGPARG